MLFRLAFPALKSMHAFLPAIDKSYKVVNPRTLVIVCDCTETLCNLAKEKFGAEVMVIEP